MLSLAGLVLTLIVLGALGVAYNALRDENRSLEVHAYDLERQLSLEQKKREDAERRLRAAAERVAELERGSTAPSMIERSPVYQRFRQEAIEQRRREYQAEHERSSAEAQARYGLTPRKTLEQTLRDLEDMAAKRK